MAITGNKLLDVLSEPVQAEVLECVRRVDLPAQYLLHRSGEAACHAFFLTRGIASLVVNMHSGVLAEVGMMGCEGIVGGEALLGSAISDVDAVMQGRGAGLRISLKNMEMLFHRHEELRSRVLQFQQVQMQVGRQISACNQLHEAEGRLSRWLLTAADRAGADTLAITQERVGNLLGLQRTTIAITAGTLQRKGMIHYRRGVVRISDRERLSKTACGCYEVTRGVTARLYPDARREEFPRNVHFASTIPDSIMPAA